MCVHLVRMIIHVHIYIYIYAHLLRMITILHLDKFEKTHVLYNNYYEGSDMKSFSRDLGFNVFQIN